MRAISAVTLPQIAAAPAAFTTNSAGNVIVNIGEPNKMSAEFIANRIQEEAHDKL